MVDQAKNLMIGLFVLAATLVALFILFFIHPSVGDEGKLLRVRFANIDKVSIGTRVTFGGKPVGEVIAIKEIIPEADPRQEHRGYVYVYELTLAVDSSVNVYNSDEVALRTSGLLGEKSVNIAPKAPIAGKPLLLMDDQIIYADEGASVEETFKEIKDLSDKVDEALDAVIESLNEIKENEMWAKIAGTFGNLEEITTALNRPKEWTEIFDNISDTASNSRELTDSGKVVLAQIRDGEGTVGKLVMSDDLYLRFTSILSKAETTLNDVNHYGILFHLDKNWQRLRARRLNLLQRLCTPQEFRNYFNDEIDKISTSLSRVAMVLDKKGYNSMCCPNVIRDLEFSKVFSELLRRMEDVEDNLKMYNTQLNDTRVKETELWDCPCK